MKSGHNAVQADHKQQLRMVSAQVRALLANESFPMMYNGSYCLFACQVHNILRRDLDPAAQHEEVAKAARDWQTRGLDPRVLNRILTEVFASRPGIPEPA